VIYSAIADYLLTSFSHKFVAVKTPLSTYQVSWSLTSLFSTNVAISVTKKTPLMSLQNII